MAQKRRSLLLSVALIFFLLIVLVGLLNHVSAFLFEGHFAYRWHTFSRLFKKPGNQSPNAPKFQWQGTGLITLWFDDAWLSQFEIAFGLLKSFKMKAALAVPTDFVGKAGFMNWDDLRELQENGWEITDHSASHRCDLVYYKDQRNIDHELVDSKKKLESQGLHIEQFVMPCGYDLEGFPEVFNIIKTAKLYFHSYRTTRGVFENDFPEVDPYQLYAQLVFNNTTEQEVQKWIDNAKKEKKWLILVFHQVDDSGNRYSITPEAFRKILTMIKSSGLPVVLPKQMLTWPNKE